MKLCTRVTVTDGQVGEILDISFVDDAHQFGLTPDGTVLHIEGRVVDIRDTQPRTADGVDTHQPEG